MCITSRIVCVVILINFFGYVSTTGVSHKHNVSLSIYTFGNNYQVMQRSNALKQRTILLKSNNSVKIPFCVRRDAEYTLMAIRYSNDGDSDVISVWLNSKMIGFFKTIASSNYGILWNVFHESGQIGEPIHLKSGTYELDLRVEKADIYGLEIDALILQTTDTTVGEEILECSLHCLSAHHSDVDINPTTTPMQLVQRSFPTKCAEQDNVDIAVFHKHVTEYQITASYPRYNWSFNSRDAAFQNCEELSPQLLWRLEEKTSDPTQNVETNVTSFELDLLKEKPLTINITFRLKGKADGLIDSDIGSVLIVQFQKIYNSLDVSCRYINRSGQFSTPTSNLITKEQQTVKYNIPDYSWTEHKVNTIQLILTSTLDIHFKIASMELSRRDEIGQKNTNIYQDNDTIIEGRNVDFWWRRPLTMTIKTPNRSFTDIDFIAIYKRIPFTNRFNQIVILYEDGNFRLLPLPPQGFDWTPFGSSIIIGQSKISSFRPFADISVIEVVSITPIFIKLRLDYFDGGSASVTIKTENLKTFLNVSELSFGRPLHEYPFVRFRSMWVTDGNCDVDHMKINGQQNIEILKPWNRLNASIVEFFRLCQSRHLNLSPDYILQVLN